MNYQRVYNNIIQQALTRKISGYFEKHHIIPKCMGGSDEQNNLCDLTAREHYICHVLLVKMYPANTKLLYAWNMMNNMSDGACKYNKRYYKSKKYATLKQAFSKARSKDRIGFKHKEETKIKIRLANKGKISKLKNRTYEDIHGCEKAQQLKANRSVSAKNRSDYNDPERCKKLSDRVITDEWRLKNSLSKKGRKQVNDGINRKMIPSSELESYLTSGWSLGWKI